MWGASAACRAAILPDPQDRPDLRVRASRAGRDVRGLCKSACPARDWTAAWAFRVAATRVRRDSEAAGPISQPDPDAEAPPDAPQVVPQDSVWQEDAEVRRRPR